MPFILPVQVLSWHVWMPEAYANVVQPADAPLSYNDFPVQELMKQYYGEAVRLRLLVTTTAA